MKIITDDAVYIQKNDIEFLTETDIRIPSSILLKVIGDEITIIDDNNRFEFIKFEDESEIEFFKNIDWIVDYYFVKDLDESEFIKLGQSVVDEKNNIVEKYNSISNIEKKHYKHMLYDCKKLEFKIYSLRDILWFKQGHIQFNLPDGIDYPEELQKMSEKGLRRLLNKFKNYKK